MSFRLSFLLFLSILSTRLQGWEICRGSIFLTRISHTCINQPPCKKGYELLEIDRSLDPGPTDLAAHSDSLVSFSSFVNEKETKNNAPISTALMTLNYEDNSANVIFIRQKYK